MGLIFLKSESRQFINDCQSNIQNGQDVIQDLKTGCEVSNQLLANLENWSKRCKRKPTNFLNLLK